MEEKKITCFLFIYLFFIYLFIFFPDMYGRISGASRFCFAPSDIFGRILGVPPDFFSDMVGFRGPPDLGSSFSDISGWIGGLQIFFGFRGGLQICTYFLFFSDISGRILGVPPDFCRILWTSGNLRSDLSLSRAVAHTHTHTHTQLI